MAGPSALAQAPTPSPSPGPSPTPPPTSGPTPPAANANTNRVQQTADAIRGDLTGHWYNPVGGDDVQRAVDRLTALTPAEQRDVVRNLAADGTLDHFTAEMTDGSWIAGGLSADQKRDFFNQVAQSLDGASLAQLSASFGRTDRQGDREDVTALADAVATHAAGAVKADYVAALAGQSTTDNTYHVEGHFGYAQSDRGDPEALAISRVLGSMQGQPEAYRAFQAVAQKPEVLKSVAEASVGQSMISAGDGTSSVLHDPKAFQAMAGALAAMRPQAGVAQADINDLRAHVFGAGAETLKDVPSIDKDAAKAITGGLTQIVQSDATGVMRELTFNADTRDGSAFAGYAKAMMNTGQQAKLGEMFTQMQIGGDLNNPQDPIARFESYVTLPNGERRYENAAAMGYFAGGLRAAAQSITKDEQGQADQLTAVLKIGLTLLDKSGAGGKVVGAAAASVKEVVQFGARAAVDALSDHPENTARALELAGVPSDPKTGETAVGSNSFSAYEDATTFVERNAKP